MNEQLESGTRDKRATMNMTEFSELTGIARSTVYDLARKDRLPIPVIRFGRRMVVSRALAEQLIAGEYRLDSQAA